MGSGRTVAISWKYSKKVSATVMDTLVEVSVIVCWNVKCNNIMAIPT